jgi:YD repeat-containing protein
VGAAPYTYDDDSLLTSVDTLAIFRDPDNGRVTGTEVGDIITSETANGFGELETFDATVAGNELFSQTIMARDELGRITRLQETVEGDTTEIIYTYDSAGRLESVTTNGDTVRYYYDQNGNRYPEAGESGASYDSQDRIQSYADMTFQTTDAGDVVQRINGPESEARTGNTGYELVYSRPLGALRTATVDGNTVTYETDPFGRRVGRQVSGGARRGYVYSSGLQIVAEVDPSTGARTVFIYGTRANVPEMMIKGGATYYRFVTDH